MEDATQTASYSPEGIYKELEQRFFWINAKWNIFKRLFAHSRERVELLNESSPFFFAICQEVFQDDVILSLARLSDSRQTGRHDNLSIDQVVNLFNSELSLELQQRLQNQVNIVEDLLEPFKKVRHKRIAHNDLRTALKIDSLDGISFEEVERALAAISRLLNIIQLHWAPNNEVAHTMTITRSDGDDLIFALEQAKKYDELERQKYNLG